jgi:uncharacterized protein (TIGR03435 family)
MRHTQTLPGTFRLATAGIVAVGLVSALRAQAPATDMKLPAFEVASVKPTKISGTSLVRPLPGGRFSVINFSLAGLIKRAYRLQDNQLVGGPDWIRSEGYDIEAKAESAASAEQMLLMLRTLLTERFRLALRTERRELPVYALVLVKSDGATGPQLKRSSQADCLRASPSTSSIGPPTDPKRPMCGLYSPTGRWTGRGVSLDTVANALTRFVGRGVQNRTGLTGEFDLDLQWTDLALLLSPTATADPPPLADGPSLFTALQEQLGLKLESTKGPVEVLVIDHVEQPTPD